MKLKPNDLLWNCFVFLNDLLASFSRDIKIWKLINLCQPRANSKTVRGKTPNSSGDEFSSRHTSSPLNGSKSNFAAKYNHFHYSLYGTSTVAS